MDDGRAFSRVFSAGVVALCNWPSVGVKRFAYSPKTNNLFVPLRTPRFGGLNSQLILEKIESHNF
jgi:hypothetical protein